MPVFEKREFADHYDIKTKDLAKYIQRGKVIEVDGKIDTNDIVNAAWCLSREQLNVKKAMKAENTTEKVSAEVKSAVAAVKKEAAPAPKFEFPPETKLTLQETFQMEGKLKGLQVEKQEIDITLQREKLQKIQGETLPTELVKSLFAMHSKSITVAFRNAADNLLMEMSVKYSISGDEVGALRDLLVKIINDAVNASIKESEIGLKNLVEEYSTKKGVGERDV